MIKKSLVYIIIFNLFAVLVACSPVVRLTDMPVGVETDMHMTSISTESFDEYAPIKFWQTYAPSPFYGVHEWVNDSFEYEITRLLPISDSFRTGFGFVHQGKLIFQDLANGHQYKFNKLSYEKKYEKVGIPNFEDSVHKFNFKNGEFSACLKLGSQSCKKISVNKGTFPYVYAEKNGSVIVITNYGEALLFSENKWCRMTMLNDFYSCKKPEPEPLSEPRKIQFYSSVFYENRVLIGEWPTGRIYEFDGSTLRPSDMTPPEIDQLSHKRLGYEAQSMAQYCGDLFVGYWPKGELWKYDSEIKTWSFFYRFFSSVENESFIPYSDRPDDGLGSAFFGQRITALIPYEDSLYVTTSNLRSWHSNLHLPDWLNIDSLSEYGAIYEINRKGCKSTYATSRL